MPPLQSSATSCHNPRSRPDDCIPGQSWLPHRHHQPLRSRLSLTRRELPIWIRSPCRSRSTTCVAAVKKHEKAQWGVAAPSSSAQFKSTTSLKNKPLAKRWDHLLSEESLSRKGNSLKQAAKFLGKPGIISLGGGLPAAEYFPFADLSIKVPQVPNFSEQETEANGVVLHSGKHDLVEDKSIFDISTAFNYGQGCGAAQLLRWVTEHTELVHDPPYQDWACNITVGSSSALDMALRMFCQRGDYIMSEEYTFSAAVETAAPMGIKVAPIKMDEEGLLPGALDDVLTNWNPEQHNGAKRPNVLYTVPTGQNPTGATQGAERRRQIYRICQKHDIYIFEDDPYFFLQMQPYVAGSMASPPPPKHDDFIKSLEPSYLRLDVDGRVMRMDSFSKSSAPVPARAGSPRANNSPSGTGCTPTYRRSALRACRS